MHALCLNHLLIFDASTAHDSLELESGQNYFNMHQVKKISSFAFMCHIRFPPKGGLISESNGRFSNCPKNVPKTILNYYIQYMAMIKY